MLIKFSKARSPAICRLSSPPSSSLVLNLKTAKALGLPFRQPFSPALTRSSNEAAHFHRGVGSAAAWPVVARAQKTGRMRRVVVAIGPESDLQQQQSAAIFRDRLRKLGWSEGQNIRIEFIWVVVGTEAAKAFVVGIAAAPPDVVVTTGLNGFLAMRQDASAVPWFLLICLIP